jgi:[ribosomal protein S5]-alanine N-acetyltransferase
MPAAGAPPHPRWTSVRLKSPLTAGMFRSLAEGGGSLGLWSNSSSPGDIRLLTGRSYRCCRRRSLGRTMCKTERAEKLDYSTRRRVEGHDASMSLVPVLDALETDRLILRHRRAEEAGIYRQLWTERDPRVPMHRRIDPEGRPTVEDIAAQIRAARQELRPGILAVERRGTADVIGYCGLIFDGSGAPDEPELVYELLRAAHGCGYATEAAGAVVTWARRVTRVCGQRYGTGMSRRAGSCKSSGSARRAAWRGTPSTERAC